MLRPPASTTIGRREVGTHPGGDEERPSGQRRALLVLVVEVRRGEPVGEILAAAHEHRVDLVLMPAARGDLVDRLLRRATLETVRREARMPVLEIAATRPGVTR
jgi:nucleotide-binding universal stress UspA family protein